LIGVVVGAIGAQAQEKKTETTTTVTTTTVRPWTEPASRWQKGSDILGKNVENKQNENLGEVDDLIIDLDSGRIIYYFVNCEMGKECIVPASAMFLPSDAKKFSLNTTKDQIKAYAVEKKRLPEFGDRTYATQVYTHYNVKPYWDASGTKTTTTEHVWYRFPARWQKASELIGMDVRNQQNENLGKIEDLAIDPDSNRVLYGVLSFGGFLGVGDKFFTVPWSSLRSTTADQKTLLLSVDKDRLKTATGFDKKNWPNMAERTYSVEVHKFYGQEPYWVEPTKP
jgi:sporulation protein YlmC with PRC-barrel domain